ncbi:YgaP family membrane protein [Evansella cellulosilytica]|uniref:Inner membrane protein YgaP-like transmembrane domain-containing protein n=1 Tax=Evansella cellulosilytica (strain ATCC 21833 / DSM 2522 / FERM P-1141 / JCM 9156 / N-4) TaxID=649639 RepID=E6TWM5_EVAC2|nr:DUF2892 domain-containing protein [Evansella cellulosilytica]ADU28708.1 hypothetical protein Bcell_0426 [Evansella cellulosilytica DSM 2522]
MKQNIGTLNALIRITCGFSILAWATAKLVRRSNETMPLLLAMMGAMKVAEGFTRFCPLTYIAEQSMDKNNDNTSYRSTHHTESANGSEPINPT